MQKFAKPLFLALALACAATIPAVAVLTFRAGATEDRVDDHEGRLRAVETSHAELCRDVYWANEKLDALLAERGIAAPPRPEPEK